MPSAVDIFFDKRTFFIILCAISIGACSSTKQASNYPAPPYHLSIKERVALLEERYTKIEKILEEKFPEYTHSPSFSSTTKKIDTKAQVYDRPINLQNINADLPILPEPILDVPVDHFYEALGIRFGKHADKHRIVIDFQPNALPEYEFVTSRNMINVTLHNTIWKGPTVGFPDINGLWVEHYNVEQKDSKAMLNLGVSDGVYVYKIFDIPAKEPDQNVRLVIDVTQ